MRRLGKRPRIFGNHQDSGWGRAMAHPEIDRAALGAEQDTGMCGDPVEYEQKLL